MKAPLAAAALLLAAVSSAAPPKRIGVKDQGGCTGAQRGVIEKARAAARARAQASSRLAAQAARDDKAAAKLKPFYAFLDADGFDPSHLPDLVRILGQIDGLIKDADYHCSEDSDKFCGLYGGYVIVGEGGDIVHLCPYFFEQEDGSKAATLDHEAAHVLDDRITDADAQGRSSYCGAYDCHSACSDGPVVDGKPRRFYVADNWAHFMHCASGQKPDEGMVIEGHAPAKTKKK